MATTSPVRAERLDAGASGVRLGIDQPAGWWLTTARCKSYEAAGFTHVQVRMPPRSLLADPVLLHSHARSLAENLAFTSLELVLHAPDDLLAGSEAHDRQLEGALEYAALVDAAMLVYHGARVPLDDPRCNSRLRDEEHALRRLLPRAAELGVQLAIENLAPVYPGPEYVSHNPRAVDELVRRLGDAGAGTCLDLGHAHIVAGLAGCELLELVESVLDRVILFQVHDNYGARAAAPRTGGIEPVKLDLHLPPGAGTLPWRTLADVLGNHPAPLQLEIHPGLRPEPATLMVLTRELLRLR